MSHTQMYGTPFAVQPQATLLNCPGLNYPRPLHLLPKSETEDGAGIESHNRCTRFGSVHLVDDW